LFFWFLPGFVGLIAGDDSKAFEDVTKYADEGVVGILAAALLFVLPLGEGGRRVARRRARRLQPRLDHDRRGA
jgi:hypothetical protein